MGVVRIRVHALSPDQFSDDVIRGIASTLTLHLSSGGSGKEDLSLPGCRHDSSRSPDQVSPSISSSMEEGPDSAPKQQQERKD